MTQLGTAPAVSAAAGTVRRLPRASRCPRACTLWAGHRGSCWSPRWLALATVAVVVLAGVGVLAHGPRQLPPAIPGHVTDELPWWCPPVCTFQDQFWTLASWYVVLWVAGFWGWLGRLLRR